MLLVPLIILYILIRRRPLTAPQKFKKKDHLPSLLDSGRSLKPEKKGEMIKKRPIYTILINNYIITTNKYCMYICIYHIITKEEKDMSIVKKITLIVKKITFWFRVIKNIAKLLNPDLFPEHWQNELDLKDLARGRWLRYKETAAPQYSVGLDKDTEALLEQKLIYDITHFKRKLTGKEEIRLTNKMIEICLQAAIEGKRVRDLL